MPSLQTPSAARRRGAVPISTPPMEAKLVEALPDGAGWRFEPKWDGFRCLAFKDGERVELMSKSGKPLGRYFPEMVEAMARLPVDRCVLDGELTISLGGRLDFDALQARLHPAASRIAKLSHETPAEYVVFDCLAGPDGASLLGRTLKDRRKVLEQLCKAFGGLPIRLSPGTEDREQAQAWFAEVGEALDGVVAKALHAPYQPGERAMLKVKLLRTADCVVGGFRYDREGWFVVSLLLGLYDEAGQLNHVGFTSTITASEKPDLTKRLERLVAKPGFSGKAPGGPSRWTTERSAAWQPLKPELVVEVRYDHVTGDRFRHGTKLLRWRPDKAPRQCTMEQLAPPASPERLEAAIG